MTAEARAALSAALADVERDMRELPPCQVGRVGCAAHARRSAGTSRPRRRGAGRPRGRRAARRATARGPDDPGEPPEHLTGRGRT